MPWKGRSGTWSLLTVRISTEPVTGSWFVPDGESAAIGPNVVSTLGQKIPTPGELAQAWQDRVDKVFVADLMIQLGLDPFLTFKYIDGLLSGQNPDGHARHLS